MSFATLGLSPALQRAVENRGYVTPTAIQAAAIPEVLRGRDVLGVAQTGSGKTAAFVLPILNRLMATRAQTPRPVRALVLVPTRELAMQVGQTCADLAGSARQGLKTVVVYGGVSINPQMMELRGGADIVVATPGRLLDLVGQNALRLGDVNMLVLDEADRLLDLGFAEELQRLLSLLPAFRQSLFFSATFPPAVKALADGLLANPVRIEAPRADADGQPVIEQRAIEVDANRRSELLTHLLQKNKWSQVLVFVAARDTAEHLFHSLGYAGITVAPFHGDLSQRKRTTALAEFKARSLRVIVATDVAARGLDIEKLPVVLNYDLPRSAVDYTHRIGRTGRAGESGLAISFVCPQTEAHFALIEKRHRIKVPRERIAGFEPTPLLAVPGAAQKPLVGADNGGVKGKRKSKKDKLREAAARNGEG